MTCLGNAKKVVLSRCRLLVNKWHKVVVLLREFDNLSKYELKNLYNKFKQYRWYEIIIYNFKQIQIFSRTLEIGVQRSLVLPTQDSNCHLM